MQTENDEKKNLKKKQNDAKKIKRLTEIQVLTKDFA